MRRKILMPFAWLLLLFSRTSGQEYGTLPDHTPLPPNTASLFKTIEKPIGTFTGVPSISIPLYTASRLGVDIPVTLTYNASGIKVEEMAGNVGLGWNLSLGGSIVRIKNGLADDNQYNGWLNTSFKPSAFTGTYQQLYDYSVGFLDMEPDVYMYSFNGHSGRFAFDESKQIVILDKPADIKITKINGSSNSIGGFVITDEKGDVYTFDGATTTYDNEYFYGSWSLSTITNRNGVAIASFQYVASGFQYQTRIATSITKYFGGNTLGCDGNAYAGYDILKYVTVDEGYVSQVTIGEEKIVFSYTSRLDRYAGGDLKLSKIEVKDAGNTVIKKFNFNYDYFISPGDPSATTAANDMYKRLKLKNVSEQPAAGTDSLTYSFIYNESVMLPQRLSSGIDYWGFYNGSDGNSSVIPNGLYYYGTTAAVSGYGERRTDHSYTGANTLTKITYPSGGYREFTYEGNTVLYNEYYKNENLSCDADDHTTQTIDEYSFNNSNPMTDPALTYNFTVNSDYGASLFSWFLNGGAFNFYVRIVDLNNWYETTLVDFNNGLTYGYYAVPNGNYRLEVYYDTYGYFDHLFAWWDELSVSSSTIERYDNTYLKTHRNVGGLRVKRIDDYDPITAQHHYTDFKYRLPEDTMLSSGMLVSVPRVMFKGNCPGKDCDLMRISNQSAYPLNADDGSYVMYPFVTVSESGNGRTEYAFTCAADGGSDFFAFPMVPGANNKAYRGQLLYANHYNQAGTLIQSDTKEYEYVTAPYYSAYGLRLAIHRLDYYDPLYCTNSVDMYPTWAPQVKTELSTTYTPNGNLQAKTEYTYFDNLGKSGINKIKVTRSDGNATTSWYRYPYNSVSDFRLPLSAPEKLIKDTLLYYNVLQPMEITNYIKRSSDSVFLGGTKLSYDFFSSALELKKVKNFTSFSDSTTVNYSNYDGTGNVREVYKTDGVKEVYLWGYNYDYVVAKVIGSDYATVAALVNNSVLQSPSSASALRTELNNIRTGLAGSKAQVSTFTYLPAVGMSSATDPAGRTIYYEYDAHGRLVRVRDQDNNILKKNAYSVTQ